MASSIPATTAQPLRHPMLRRPAKPDETPPPSSRTVTIIDGSSGARKLVTIPGNPDATKPLFDPKLVEATRHGAVPKIGPDGARPSSRYAQPRQLPPSKKDSPLIAVIVGGVGISTSGTAIALAKLPASVTFALTPYGVDLEKRHRLEVRPVNTLAAIICRS